MEKPITSRVLHRGRSFNFMRDEVSLQSGRRTFRDFVDHLGGVTIIPIISKSEIVLVRQYRYAVGKYLLEIPAGTIEVDESPLDCARRELREETGYEAGVMEELLRCYLAPGYSSELMYIYVARDLKEVGSRAEPDEELQIENLELDKIVSMIDKNLVKDAKTICGILALNRLETVKHTQIDNGNSRS